MNTNGVKGTKMEPDAEDSKVRDLVQGRAEISGSAVGAALGFLAAGPAGAAALGATGGALGIVLKRIGSEVANRLISPRERIRLGGVLALTAAVVEKRLNAGEELRKDGFFERDSHSRSDAEEVAEGLLLKSQREPEERKLPYMANLLANVAFDPTVSGSLAHQLSRSAEQLTWRELWKVSAHAKALGLRATDYRGQTNFSKELIQILYECFDLYQRSLIHFGGGVAFGPTDVLPGSMTVQGLGADLYRLMNLEAIPSEELVPLVRQLK